MYSLHFTTDTQIQTAYYLAKIITPVEIIFLVRCIRWLAILAEGPLLCKCNDFLYTELFIIKLNEHSLSSSLRKTRNVLVC